MRKAIREEKTVEIERENRLNNFIIYRGPESKGTNGEDRKKDDKKIIDDLLSNLEVEDRPVKFFRLGRYNPTLGNENKGRPIKVVMESQEAQLRVMKNLRKLKSSPDHQKSLSIAYDTTLEERKILKDRVAEAKTKLSSSTAWMFKVYGPPWDLREIKIRKS